MAGIFEFAFAGFDSNSASFLNAGARGISSDALIKILLLSRLGRGLKPVRLVNALRGAKAPLFHGRNHVLQAGFKAQLVTTNPQRLMADLPEGYCGIAEAMN
jgi:hypothetical protein